MTTPTNDRQTSERERLHGVLSQLAEIEQLKAELAALRAENEALRTAGDELMEACKQRDNALIDRTMSRRLALDTVDLDAIHEAVAAASRRYNAALQSFIRSKESRRAPE